MTFPQNSLRRAALAATLALSSATAASAEGTVVAGKYGDWTLHLNEGKSYKICFITAEPEEKGAAAGTRVASLFYVSAWPKDGVKAEVSVKLGFAVKTGSEVKVSVDKDSFKLFPKDERAFVADATQELKLIEAMKKGTRLKVEAKSERGSTSTTDGYSLSGFSQAMTALAQACP